jgi:translation initiation factor 4E
MSTSTEKKLENKFVFWYHIINNTPSDQDYKAQIKKLAQFDTLENFWAIFQYLKKPDDIKQPIEFQLFKEGIAPMWEDDQNKNGGRIALKLRKEYSNLVWEELVFAFIGGYFAKEIKDEINGLVINCKKDFNTLQIWTKSFSDEVTSGIEKNIREILSIPKEVVLDIKPFSMQQNKEYNSYHSYNNYNNYNNYKGNYQKKKQSNNYYKKKETYENNNKDFKHSDSKEEPKEESDKGKKKQDDLDVKKKESVESKDSMDMESPKDKEDFKEVKKKKKKKKE